MASPQEPSSDGSHSSSSALTRIVQRRLRDCASLPAANVATLVEQPWKDFVAAAKADATRTVTADCMSDPTDRVQWLLTECLARAGNASGTAAERRAALAAVRKLTTLIDAAVKTHRLQSASSAGATTTGPPTEIVTTTTNGSSSAGRSKPAAGATGSAITSAGNGATANGHATAQATRTAAPTNTTTSKTLLGNLASTADTSKDDPSTRALATARNPGTTAVSTGTSRTSRDEVSKPKETPLNGHSGMKSQLPKAAHKRTMSAVATNGSHSNKTPSKAGTNSADLCNTNQRQAAARRPSALDGPNQSQESPQQSHPQPHQPQQRRPSKELSRNNPRGSRPEIVNASKKQHIRSGSHSTLTQGYYGDASLSPFQETEREVLPARSRSPLRGSRAKSDAGTTSHGYYGPPSTSAASRASSATHGTDNGIAPAAGISRSRSDAGGSRGYYGPSSGVPRAQPSQPQMPQSDVASRAFPATHGTDNGIAPAAGISSSRSDVAGSRGYYGPSSSSGVPGAQPSQPQTSQSVVVSKQALRTNASPSRWGPSASEVAKTQRPNGTTGEAASGSNGQQAATREAPPQAAVTEPSKPVTMLVAADNAPTCSLSIQERNASRLTFTPGVLSAEASRDFSKRLTLWDPFWSVVGVVKIGLTSKVDTPTLVAARTAAQLDFDIAKLVREHPDKASSLSWGNIKSDALKDGDCSVLLRMLPLHSHGTDKRADCHLWPKGTFLQVNGKAVRLSQRKQQTHDDNLWKGMCKHVDVTEHIADTKQVTRIQICCYDDQPYLFYLALCKFRSADAVYDILMKPGLAAIQKLSREESLRKAVTSMTGKMVILDDSDDEFGDHDGDTKLVFSLICPLSKTLIQTPVRGKTCKHWQVRTSHALD